MIEIAAVAANYITKFFAVVVVNCFAYPENLPYCARIDSWLVPDIQHHIGYLTGEKKPYDNEKKILENRDGV